MGHFVTLPYDYNFDFGTTNLAVGNIARIDTAAAYTVNAEGQTWTTPVTLPPDTYAEISGAEIFPGIVAGQYEHLDYVKIYVGGKGHDDQLFNELTAPGLSAGQPDVLGAAGLRHGIMATNIGMPMMLGGRPDECTIKVPPGKTIDVEVAAPPAAEGGAALTCATRVRLWITRVAGAEKLKRLLKMQSIASGHGYYDGNVMNCSFDLGDPEVEEKMPIRYKINGNPVKMPVGDGPFEPLDHWAQLPGGMNQGATNMHVYSMFSKQMAATTINSWYQFTSANQFVQDKQAELYWEFDKTDALKLTHLSFKNPAVGVIDDLRMKRSGREIENEYDVRIANNPFPMPRNRTVGNMSYLGPGKLARPFLVWGEIGSIEVRDNGTSVAPWTSVNTDAAAIYARGIRYELDSKEV